MYADDSKIIAPLYDQNSSQNLQEDLFKVCDWTNTWLMSLNSKKCKALHFGKYNDNQKYFLKDSSGDLHEISTSESERDLGVTINSNLKWHEHNNNVATKANRILGTLKKTFESRDSNLWKKLYISLVRPHLEFAVQVWHPTLRGDIEAIEKVQERALRIPHSHKHLGYVERLKSWGITTLQERRNRGDAIQLYKSLHGLEVIDWVNPPTIRSSNGNIGPASSTRGHSLRIDRETFKSKLRNDYAAAVSTRHNFFRNRVIPHWNALSKSTVLASSLEKFKVDYDQKRFYS